MWSVPIISDKLVRAFFFKKKTHVAADSEISGTTGKGIVEEAAALEAALV